MPEKKISNLMNVNASITHWMPMPEPPKEKRS